MHMTNLESQRSHTRYALLLVLALSISVSTLMVVSAAVAKQNPEAMVTDKNGMEYVAGEYVVFYEDENDAKTEEPTTGTVV